MPASFEVLVLDTNLAGTFLLEQIEGHVAQDGKAVRTMVLAESIHVNPTTIGDLAPSQRLGHGS